MLIRTERLTLRPWQRGDEAALVPAANHREIWRNLLDLFPHPYTHADADAWIKRVEEDRSGLPPLAITSGGGELLGGIGVMRLADLSRFTGSLGYWVTPAAWGRGYATEALRAFRDQLWSASDLQRLEARVLEWNPASCRVLEKSGFRQDARLRHSAFKDGRLIDEWLYSCVRQ